MRRYTRFGLAATVAALAAGGMTALAGAVPASAASAHPAPSIKITTDGVTVRTLSTTVCSFSVSSQKYFSSYGYWTIKAWYSSSGSCGTILQAGITCSNTNLWGRQTTGVGQANATVAACNRTYPTFDHGGYRLWNGSSWQYYTFLY